MQRNKNNLLTIRDIGHYKRNFHTTAGEVELKAPKHQGIPLEAAIMKRCRPREASVEEALDVSGRCFRPAGGKYHRSFMGDESISRNNQQPEQEGI